MAAQAPMESVETGDQLEATCYVAIELPITHRILLRHEPPELAIQAVLLYDAVHLLALVLLLLVCSCINGSPPALVNGVVPALALGHQRPDLLSKL